MLKVNVGLSRKLTKNYDSTGFSLNLEGEVCVPLDDPEGVVEKIKELYDLAEESLNQQVERYEGDSSIAIRNETPPSRPSNGNGRGNGYGRRANPAQKGNGNQRNGNDAGFTPASNKQISFMTNLAKRQGLTTPQLQKRVAEIVGREVDLYDLSKSEAGIVLNELTAEDNVPAGRRR